jgi:hypothetical protein
MNVDAIFLCFAPDSLLGSCPFTGDHVNFVAPLDETPSHFIGAGSTGHGRSVEILVQIKNLHKPGFSRV